MSAGAPSTSPRPLTARDLRALAKARVKDAECLFAGHRYDGAAYLCGYAIELALKARICTVLKWAHFRPDASAGPDKDMFRAFRSHNLALLLAMTGREELVKSQHFTDWSAVLNWSPEMRYRHVGGVSRNNAADLIAVVKRLLRVI